MKPDVSNLTENDWIKMKKWLENRIPHQCPEFYDCERCNDLFPGSVESPDFGKVRKKKRCPCNRFGEDHVVEVVEKILNLCEFYPSFKDECVCAANSDISGAFVCTKEYSKQCQWAYEKREEMTT